MWHRDRALVEMHIADLTRDAAARRLADAGTHGGPHVGLGHRVRVATASAIRWSGRGVLAIAARIDDAPAAEPQASPSVGDMAFHHS